MMMAISAGSSSPSVLGVLVTTVFHTCSAAGGGKEEKKVWDSGCGCVRRCGCGCGCGTRGGEDISRKG